MNYAELKKKGLRVGMYDGIVYRGNTPLAQKVGTAKMHMENGQGVWRNPPPKNTKK